MENKKHELIKEEFRSNPNIKGDYKVSPFEKYNGKFRTSFGTLLLGVLLGIIGLVLLGYSEGIDNDLNIVRRAPLIQEENLIRTSGTIKLVGLPNIKEELKAPNMGEDLLYYLKVNENKINGEWKQVNKQEFATSFYIGEIYIDTSKADFEFNLDKISENETGNTREITYGVYANNPIMVIGSLHGKSIGGGSVLIVSNKSNKDIIKSVSNIGNRDWWVYKVGALLLIALGIVSLILPILTFLDVFPQLGLNAILLIFLFSFLVSSLLVFVAAIIVTFWWVIFVIVGAVLILLVRIKSKRRYYHPISFTP
ncbi:hypothetical protein J7J83_03615 [bacterium]|nr:hypothetical protein [bacterium]